MAIDSNIHHQQIANAAPGMYTFAAVEHCGRVWNLGDLDKKFNLRLYKYKLHFKLKHRKEMKK